MVKNMAEKKAYVKPAVSDELLGLLGRPYTIGIDGTLQKTIEWYPGVRAARRDHMKCVIATITESAERYAERIEKLRNNNCAY